MRTLYYLLPLLLLAACHSRRHAEPGPEVLPPVELCACRYTDSLLKKVPLVRLGEEYQRLARTGGREACDAFGSGLHQTLDALVKRVPATQPDTSALRQIMGPPVARIAPGAEITTLRKHLYGTLPAGDLVWEYPWRAGHDWVWVRFRQGKFMAMEWFMAYE